MEQTSGSFDSQIAICHSGRHWIGAACAAARTCAKGHADDERPTRILYANNSMCEATLTDREVEVLELVARGHSNRAISELLGIRLQTVKNHLSNIFVKLDVNSRASAAQILSYRATQHV